MKWLKYIRYALLAISAIILLAWVFMGAQDAQVDGMLIWTYILLGLAVLLIVVLPLINMAKNPKGSLPSLIGLVAVVVLFVVFYSLGSGDPVVRSAGGFFENATENKLSDAGLFMTYLVMGLTIVVAVFGEVRNALK